MIEPQPTEYAGVKFRSKSEATFARVLDLRGMLWEYEPPYFATECGYVPDFFVAWQARQGSASHLLRFFLIEYKPKPVTESYKELLAKRFLSMGECAEMCRWILVCGTHFNSQRQEFGYDMGEGKWMEKDMGFTERLDEAARYRFDLKAEASRTSDFCRPSHFVTAAKSERMAWRTQPRSNPPNAPTT